MTNASMLVAYFSCGSGSRVFLRKNSFRPMTYQQAPMSTDIQNTVKTTPSTAAISLGSI